MAAAGCTDTPCEVSIPFIAGQWSLRVVISDEDVRAAPVSIPFIAGQWSLHQLDALARNRASESQSPSLRGSGRFDRPPPHGGGARRSQSPSLRGSGRFADAPRRVDEQTLVSQSPSLRGSGRFAGARAPPRESTRGLNPLHCGAVVASPGRARRTSAALGLNPLHCGAVVASHRLVGGAGRRRHVSIPFIAGQWSLPRPRTSRGFYFLESQSPSLRGSGRFMLAVWRAAAEAQASQSPSLRGSGRFYGLALRAAHGAACFNPLHCGAVVAS